MMTICIKKITAACLLILLAGSTQAQDLIPLWTKKSLPNSKHLKLKDSIANERIYRVTLPGMYAYFPSEQENKRAAVVICPGGGYERLAYVISGLQLAKWFNTIGVSAFVLNYRLPNSPDLKQREIGPLQDAQRALKYVRANAERWNIDADKIGILGSSAGGHLAALAATVDEDIASIKDSLDGVYHKPDFTILISPVIDMSEKYSHLISRKNLLGDNITDSLEKKYSAQLLVNKKTPPTFIVVANNDQAVKPINSMLFYQALRDHDVPVSFHAFPQGNHSIALRNNPGSTELWTTLCEMWLKESGFIKTQPAK